jgi:phosphatidylglycerophosphate synthase
VTKPIQLAYGRLGYWARRVLAVPNLLTLARIPLAALLWLRPHDPLWLLSIIAIAAASDVVDGRVARMLRRHDSVHFIADREVGAWLDPLCDKIFTLSALGVLCFGFSAPVGLVVLTVAREIALAPLVLVYHLFPVVRRNIGLDFRADWLGKLTTTMQYAVVVAFLALPSAALPLAVAAAGIGVGAAANYLRRGLLSTRDVTADAAADLAQRT